jgi:hypothetical protein
LKEPFTHAEDRIWPTLVHHPLECNLISGDSDSDSLHSFSLQNLFDSEPVFENNMAEQTLRQLAAPNVNYNGLCIEYADVVVPFELKSGLIH